MSKKKIAITILGIPVLLYVGLVIGYNLGTSHKKAPGTATAQAAPPSQPPTRAELLQFVNAERTRNGVAPLTENALLDKSAQWKAEDEVRYGYFGHVKPGTAGNDGLDYLNSLHPPCSNIGENLQRENYGPNTAKADVDSWISSPPHHEAMINPKYTLTGFGMSGDELVEHFCQP